MLNPHSIPLLVFGLLLLAGLVILAVLIFRALREFMCWYWKLNEIVGLLQRIEKKLEELVKGLPG